MTRKSFKSKNSKKEYARYNGYDIEITQMPLAHQYKRVGKVAKALDHLYPRFQIQAHENSRLNFIIAEARVWVWDEPVNSECLDFIVRWDASETNAQAVIKALRSTVRKYRQAELSSKHRRMTHETALNRIRMVNLVNKNVWTSDGRRVPRRVPPMRGPRANSLNYLGARTGRIKHNDGSITNSNAFSNSGAQ